MDRGCRCGFVYPRRRRLDVSRLEQEQEQDEEGTRSNDFGGLREWMIDPWCRVLRVTFPLSRPIGILLVGHFVRDEMMGRWKNAPLGGRPMEITSSVMTAVLLLLAKTRVVHHSVPSIG